MKKLETWQIILLVIFYPVGICVLIYRLVKKSKLKKEAEAREAERAAAAQARAEERARKDAERASEREKEAAYRATVNRELFRVVGVTFDNRQAILKRIKRDEPDACRLSLRLFEFEGKPAVGVYYDGEQVGNISKDDLPRVLPQIERYDKVEAYDVTGGFELEDGGGSANLGLEIAVYFKKA